MVLCALNAGPSDKLSATCRHSVDVICFNTCFGVAEHQFEFHPHHASGIRTLLRENFDILRRCPILRSPRPKAPKVLKQVAPRPKSFWERLARLKTIPQADHLSERCGIGDHQI